MSESVSPPLAVDFGRGVEDAFASIAAFVPKLIGFLIILIIGIIIARVLSRLVSTVLERVGFDRAVERGGISQALARSKYDASDIIAKLVYYAVLLVTLVIAFNVFGPNPISNLLSSVIGFLPRLAIAIVIVVVAAAIAKAVKDIISNVLGGLSYGSILATIASTIILALGVISALNTVGIATAVTTPVLIAVLATLGGILVVGVGGGLVRPMEARWDRWLSTAEQESGNLRQQIQANRGAARDTLSGYAETAREQASSLQEAAAEPEPVPSGTSTTYGSATTTVYGGSTDAPTYGGSTGSGATTYGGTTSGTTSTGSTGGSTVYGGDDDDSGQSPYGSGGSRPPYGSGGSTGGGATSI